MKLDDLLSAPQYSIPQHEKEQILLEHLHALTRHHQAHCSGYQRLIRVLHPTGAEPRSLADLPYLPVGLFKSHRLMSIAEDEVFKTLTSSGTTGQQVSRVFLDRTTAQRQTTALARIMTHALGPERLPMILVENSSLLKDRNSFSARGAGVLGMMNFGRNHWYALNDQMELDEPGLKRFLDTYGGRPFLIFGFTFMVWQYLLERVTEGVDLSHGILIHSGGWKKLQDLSVSNAEFSRRFRQKTGLQRIYNFYGMVEQVGSVYLEGDDGYLYAPNFADILIRDPLTWEVLPPGKPGVIQVLSALPFSYPGHSILTEDLGVVHGIDDGGCGRLGKYFSVLGRVPLAELRGCSDIHAAQVTP